MPGQRLIGDHVIQERILTTYLNLHSCCTFCYLDSVCNCHRYSSNTNTKSSGNGLWHQLQWGNSSTRKVNIPIHPKFWVSFRPASFLTEKWIWYICTIQLNSINPQRIHSFVRGCGCVVSRVTIRVGVGSCLGAASINSLPQYFGHRNDWRMWWEPMEAELFVQIVYQFGKWMKSSAGI